MSEKVAKQLRRLIRSTRSIEEVVRMQDRLEKIDNLPEKIKKRSMRLLTTDEHAFFHGAMDHYKRVNWKEKTKIRNYNDSPNA